MIIAIIFLLLVSFFFSLSETALTAANKSKFQTEAKNGNQRSQKLSQLLDKPSEFITTILIIKNISNIILPVLGTILAIKMQFNVLAVLVIMIIFIVLVSEVIPKAIAAANPDKTSRIVYPIIRTLVIILKPITKLLNTITSKISKSFSKDKVNDLSLIHI